MRTTVALCLVCLIISAPTTNAGTLSRARKQVRRETHHEEHHEAHLETHRKARRRREDRHDDDHHHRGGGGHYHRPPRFAPSCGPAGFFSFHTCSPAPVVETYVVQEPVYVTQPTVVDPSPVIVDSAGPTLSEQFCQHIAPYPYAYGADGFMLTTTPDYWNTFSGRILVEGGSDFDAIGRTRLSFMIEGEGGLGLDFDWNSYCEDLPGGGHDELHIGEIDGLYRFAESDQLLLHAGLGAVWFGDRYDTDFGINFTLKADFAPCDPIVLSGEIDLGTLGDAQHVHLSGTAGVMLNRCELYGGYDYRRIGDVEIQGPMVGLRVWF